MALLIQVSYTNPNLFHQSLVNDLSNLCITGSTQPSSSQLAELSIKILCNISTEVDSAIKVLGTSGHDEQQPQGLQAIYHSILSESPNSVKFGLGTIQNYLQLISKNKIIKKKDMQDLIDLMGMTDGYNHLMMAMKNACVNNGEESVVYALKIIINIA